MKIGEKSPEEIRLLEVYEAIEGPFVRTECLLDAPACGSENCILGDLPGRVHREVQDYLSGKRLSDLVGVYDQIETT